MIKALMQKFVWCLLICITTKEGLAKDFLITDFGAKAGVTELNTIPINNAIGACYRNGGGKVIIPAGVFRTGTLVLKDNVEIHLEIGAVIYASTDRKDFPLQPQPSYRSLKDTGGWRSLIYALDAINIAVTGFGTIDGNGADQLPGPKARTGDMDGRPRNILFISCKNIRVEGVHMRNSGLWNQHYLHCEDVVVDKINVYNHANRNNDGIDIDGCRRFLLSNSVFDTDDDAVCLKSTGESASEDIVITNCVISSFCNAIKTGTESTGGFKNIAISNCVIMPSKGSDRLYGDSIGIAGLSLEIVDGGIMDGVSINNITMYGTECPLFVRLGNRGRKHFKDAPEPPVGKMRNIVISNVVAYNTGNYCSSITGIPGHYVENLSLSNVQFFNKGGINKGDYIESAEKVKEDIKGYPQPTAWKELPSSGLFVRHAKNIQINGFMLNSEELDPRIPVIAVDVDGLQVRTISKIDHSGANVFLQGINVINVDVEKPLSWEKEVLKLGEINSKDL
ncbi:polygalacturonase [Ginsengibacter hankyongi]|uniref:Polygalacturonase n=1 Tax=Ginsengibacter hankyongi TaxID=2607284 RepID=A0A5J5IFQ3_9BACT|nr:glycosyl hydrolase family 28 protein [Ginsengibacter hankyongi]KAA9038683.1 polygalacturonase [Ginsengibacter hankyongi]